MALKTHSKLSWRKREEYTKKRILVKLPQNWKEEKQPPNKMLFRSEDGRHTIYIRKWGDEVYEVESATHKNGSVEETFRHHNTAERKEAIKIVIEYMRNNP